MSNIQILDGGLGQELWKRGVNKHPVLWSTNALITAPEIVLDVHLEFIAAGARIITTNTYCTNPWRLKQAGMEDEFKPLNELAAALCIEAREKALKAGYIKDISEIKIAASLPPLYGTYKTDISRSHAQMEDEYKMMAEILAPYADILLCETMTDTIEAHAAASACQGLGVPVWLAWTLDEKLAKAADTKDNGATTQDKGTDATQTHAVLREGTNITEAYRALPDMVFDALLFNCCQPEVVEHAIAELRTLTDVKIGAYANGFVPIPDEFDLGNVDVIEKRNDLSPAAYLDFAKSWTESGASIVGGCCEIGPAHIAALHEYYNGAVK